LTLFTITILSIQSIQSIQSNYNSVSAQLRPYYYLHFRIVVKPFQSVIETYLSAHPTLLILFVFRYCSTFVIYSIPVFFTTHFIGLIFLNCILLIIRFFLKFLKIYLNCV